MVDDDGEVLGVDTSKRSKWGALAMEVANSRGLCAIAEGAQRFNGERTAPSGDERAEAKPDTAALSPAAVASTGDSGSSTGRASATSEESGAQEVAGVGLSLIHI